MSSALLKRGNPALADVKENEYMKAIKNKYKNMRPPGLVFAVTAVRLYSPVSILKKHEYKYRERYLKLLLPKT